MLYPLKKAHTNHINYLAAPLALNAAKMLPCYSVANINNNLIACVLIFWLTPAIWLL